MERKYDFSAIEHKWQKYWDENKIYSVDTNNSKEKLYLLEMLQLIFGIQLMVEVIKILLMI